MAKLYDEQGADELVFLDITASSDNRTTMYDMVAAVADQVFIPFTVGGGVRSDADVRMLLEMGADKVSLNTRRARGPGADTRVLRAVRRAVHRRGHRREGGRRG